MAKKKSKLTQERLKEVLDYDPDTGIFTRRLTRGGYKKNTVAGSKGVYGDFYSYIKIDETRYAAHRLAWLYVYGYFPENQIDHIDRVRINNRIKNLREASPVCNSRNCGIAKNNISGITGVSFNKVYKKYNAYITVNYKHMSVGHFQTKKEAAMARWIAEVKYGFPTCNTTSSAYQYLKKHGEI